jgi:NADPH:quinone reductase-like Zn-dependent oxidoreductase
VWAGQHVRPRRFRRRLRADLGAVFQLLADGMPTPQIAARFSLAEASAALRPAESYIVRAQIVLTV